MDLIKLYIQEVTRRLPEKNRDDIALELESTIYDMLPEAYTEADVHHVLETLGNPAVLASKYNEKPMHLIRPKYYDLYVTLLKLVMPIAALVALIATFAGKVFHPIEDGAVMETLLTLIGEGIWSVINVLVQTFIWLTIIFAIFERVDGVKEHIPLTMKWKPWTPEDLKDAIQVPKQKEIKGFEWYFGLGWTAIWGTAYFYADHLVGIYKNGENGLRMVTPVFNQEVLLSFWPFVVFVIGVEITLAVFKYIQKQWTYKLATIFTIHQLVSTIILVVILTHPHIFTPAFLIQLGDWFATAPEVIRNRIVWGAISISIVFALWAIYDAYKKAKIKTTTI